MEIRSKEHSEISLLAIDRSIKSLASGNDLDMSDFIKTYGEYDSEIFISTYNFSNPRHCTENDEQLLKVRASTSTGPQSGRENSSPTSEVVDDLNESARSETHDAGTTVFIRSNFPESWFYETISMNDKTTMPLDVTLPDSITTWEFTAFSLNKHGFALATPKQLVVKQDFFMKVNLPYAGRIDEILDIDVIIFNFHNHNSTVNVTLSINQNGIFVERNINCSSLKVNGNRYSKTVMAKKKQGTKVAFSFQPKKIGVVKLNFNAISNDQTKRDALERSLEIVNYGIKDFKREKYVSIFNESTNFDARLAFDDFVCASISAGVVGDIVSDGQKHEQEFK